MLRITMSKSAEGAKQYYSDPSLTEGKSLDNYYTEKDQSIGTWGGKAAEKLGLTGDIRKSDFASLCDNIKPKSDDQLTARNNLDRTVGYDFTFDAGKSVSLAYTFANEDNKKQILTAFRQSVKDTMTEIETGMQARIRVNGKDENRETANFAYGEFVHFTTRPIDGIPDPQLHAHCFVFNATFDDQEEKWKAGQFRQTKQDAPYYEAVFHSTLADRLQNIGYEIERNKKGFEIKGIDRDTIVKFSNRSKEIDELAQKENITDINEKARLGAKTRENKRTLADPDLIKTNWQNRLSEEESQKLQNLKNFGIADEKKKENDKEPDEAVNYSLKHHLERKSVATDKEILTTALKSSTGEITLPKIKQAFANNKSIISVKEGNQIFITTKDALNEENALISKAFATKGTFKPIYENYTPVNQSLTDEQLKAVDHALTSCDGITIISGKAGTGKTTLMKEVQLGIVSAGKSFYAFAPSAEASRMVQRKEGFENADTVASLIQNKTLQEELKGSIIWIDEAGMLSNKNMNQILDIAERQNCRIILTGDTKQHTSVERGDALRTLQHEAGITPVQVNRIQRQKNEQYKQAVHFLAKSDVDKGFKNLEKIGAIHEVEDSTARINKIADDYYTSTHKNLKRNKDENEVLVVSPTHAEGEKVTQKIREKLKQEKILADEDRQFQTFKNLQLTAAEKEKRENYTADKWVIFHQNCKGFKAGSKYQVVDSTADNLVRLKDKEGNISAVSIDKSSNYNLYEAKDVFIAKGDKIRITGNGQANDGKHLFNGTMFRINGFDKQGNIKLSNGSSISKDYGHFSLGYVVTSHASQGKTVDKVIISQSSMSFRASSKEQFYVSVSRGRQAVSIYTDDKTDLLQAVKQSNERKSAIELTRNTSNHQNAIQINRVGMFRKIKNKAQIAAQQIKTTITKKSAIENELQRKTSAKNPGKER